MDYRLVDGLINNRSIEGIKLLGKLSRVSFGSEVTVECVRLWRPGVICGSSLGSAKSVEALWGPAKLCGDPLGFVESHSTSDNSKGRLSSVQIHEDSIIN